MKRKFFKCAKGAVSLFLIVLLLPFTQIATVLVSAQRYNSSVALLDEVIDSSSLSTLSNYDSYVRERFGLFTIAQKTDIKSKFNSYFDYNRNGMLNSAFGDSLSVDVSGGLPLNDDDILLAHIKEYNKLNAPVKMINDCLDLSELMKNFEKKLNLNNLLDMANSGVDMCNGALDFEKSYRKLQRLSDSLDNLRTTYNNAYDEFNQAIKDVYDKRGEIESIQNEENSLNSELEDMNRRLQDLIRDKDEASTNEDKEKIQKDIDELNDDIRDKREKLSDKQEENANNNRQIQSLINTFNDKRDDYAESHTRLIADLGDYKSEMRTALDNINSLIGSLGDFASSGLSTLTQAEKAAAEHDNKSIKEELNTYKTENKPADSHYYELVFQQSDNDKLIAEHNTNSTFQGGLSKSVHEVSDIYTRANQAFDEQAIQNAINTLTSQKSTVSALTADDVKNKNNGDEYHAEVNVVLNREQLKQLYDYFDDLSNNIGIDLGDIWEGIKAFFESIFKVKLVYDPALCSKIDSNYFADTFGIKIDNPATNPLAKLIRTIETFVTGLKDFVEGCASFDFVKIWEGIKGVLKSSIDTLLSLIEIQVQLISNVIEYINDPSKMLLPYYYAQTLPCRTDYKTGSNMTGAKYSKIPYVNYGDEGVNGLPVIESIVSLFNLVFNDKAADDKMFCGAELEYLISGSNSEIVNQSTVFGMLYVVRMLLDIPAWGNAVELQALGAGPHYPIVMLIYFLVEPFLDCMLLVNGGKVDIWKTQPYLSVAGMADFIPRLVTIIPGDSTTKANMKDKFARIWKGTGEALDDADYDYDKESVVDGGGEKKKNPLTNYAKDLLKWNYKEYLMAIMLLFSNNTNELMLFKNLIQMETQANNVKYSKGDFYLNKAYTQINCTVKGSATPLLATAFSDSIFKFTRHQCRGY